MRSSTLLVLLLLCFISLAQSENLISVLRTEYGRWDYAEEVRIGEDQGKTFLYGSTLHLPSNPATGQTEMTVALRFDVPIEPFVQIDQAYIQFFSDEVGSGDVLMRIFAEHSTNPNFFSRETFNISRRVLSFRYSEWAPPAWESSRSSFVSPDLSWSVQELVENEGWSNNSAIVFVIHRSPDDTQRNYRSASSGRTNSGRPPYLNITYTKNSQQHHHSSHKWPNRVGTVLGILLASAVLLVIVLLVERFHKSGSSNDSDNIDSTNAVPTSTDSPKTHLIGAQTTHSHLIIETKPEEVI